MLKREEVSAKLAGLANTAISIQTVSAWLLFHKRHVEEVVVVWREAVAAPEAPFARVLLLLYLANDVMQNALKKGLAEVAAAFGRECPAAVGRATALAGGESEAGSVRRLVGVWRERGVLPEELMAACEAMVHPVKTEAGGTGGGAGVAAGGGGGGETRVTDPRLALVVGHWEAAAAARAAAAAAGGATRAAADKQRALADSLFREAQLAVQELEKMEAAVAQKTAAAGEAPAKKQRAVAAPVAELVGNPRLLHQETLAVLSKMASAQ